MILIVLNIISVILAIIVLVLIYIHSYKRPKKNIALKRSSFQDALNIYRFDKKLRLFLFNEIEKVEISLRSALANIVAKETGNIFWLTDALMFANEERFCKTMALVDKELRNSKEEFILHFK